MYNQYIVWCFFVFKIKQNAQRKEVTKLCAFEHQFKLAQEINGVTLGKRFLGFRFSKKKKPLKMGLSSKKILIFERNFTPKKIQV
jgi:hypothetical protein